MSNAAKTITISGPPGSGTTTVAKLLGARLGLRYVNTGQIFRELAHEHGMSLPEFGHYACEHREVDDELDKRQLEIAHSGSVILEGRLAGHLTERHRVEALRVFIDADPKIRAARIAQRDGQDVAQAFTQMSERATLERQRYLEHYDIDIEDTSIYHLVLDSSAASPQNLAEEIAHEHG